MSTLLEQLAAIFDAQDWTYELDSEQGRLSTGFDTPQGSLSLSLRPLAEQAVLVEALSLATLAAEHAATLPTLAWHMPGISLARDPTDGEVRARLWLPAPGASIAAEAVQVALDLLLAVATLLRSALTLVQQGIAAEEALQRAQETLSAAPNAEVHTNDLRERLLAAKSREAVATLAEEWPEVLAPETLVWLNDGIQAVQQNGQHEAVAHLNQVQAWLTALRQGHPLLTAIFDFVNTEYWDQTRELARAEPLLHGTDALAQLDLLANKAEARGEEQRAAHYREHRQRLATWQANGFAPEERNLAVPEALRASLQELADLENKHDRTSLEHTRTLCQALLAEVHHHEAPELWAALQGALGNTCSRLYEITGVQANAQAAIDAYQAALTVRTREAMPTDWAMTQNNLASLYQSRYDRSGEERWASEATDAYQAALTVYTREAMPTNWAMTQNNLANLYQSRYDRSGEERWASEATDAYQAALTVRTREAMPTDWAMTQNNLANLYQSRYDRSGEERWASEATDAYQAALTVHTREAMPTNWATTQNNLANLYKSRYDRSGEERWASEATDAYQAALTVRTREAMPTDWAMTQNNLANLYQSRYDRSGEERWASEATDAYQAALTVRTREAMPTDWAMTQNNLASLYKSRYDRSGEERWASLAAAAYQDTLAILTPAVAPNMARRTGRSLASLYVSQRRWDAAHAVYTTALTAADNQYLAAPGDNERRHLMAEHADLYRDDAHCLVHMEQPASAWARLELGRARALGEAMGLEALASLHHGPAAADQLRALRRAVQQADHALQAADAQSIEARSQTEQQAAITVRSQARQTLEAAYTALRARITALALEPPTLDATTLASLLLPPNTAVVTLLLTPTEIQALILHGGAVRPVALPAVFTLAEINRLVHALPPQMEGWIDTYNIRMQALRALAQAKMAERTDLGAEQSALEEAEAAWHATLDTIAGSGGTPQAGWYYAYRLTYEAVRGENHPQAERAALNAWKQTVEHARAFLAEHLWLPLATALPAGVTQVLFVPTGPIALLPVHAAAPDHLAVAYTPSLGIWQQCAVRTEPLTPPATRTLFLATPADDLFFTQAEAEWLRDRATARGYQVTWLKRPQATVANVAAQARGHTIVHFSGHAGYRWHDPLASALACVDGPLTLTTIRQEMDLRLARLITLSACSTGLSDVFESGEEFVGLPAVLLETGAPAVVASLWPVNDVSTAFLMDRFYELWLGAEGLTIAGALAAATRWLSTATRADLLTRIAASSLSPETSHLVQAALETALRLEAARMADAIGLVAADEILSRPDRRPFASPHYWAAFAAWGAVV